MVVRKYCYKGNFPFVKMPFLIMKRCVRGSVLDFALDVRKGSPTYGKHVAVELTEENHRQFFIPKGFVTVLQSCPSSLFFNINAMSSITLKQMMV